MSLSTVPFTGRADAGRREMTGGATSILLELVSGRGTSRRSRMVEGQPRRRFSDNPLERWISIVQQRLGRNAKCVDARCSQPFITHRVPLRAIDEGVRLAIDLNRQPCVAAEEVEHVRSGGVLPAKLEAAGSFP